MVIHDFPVSLPKRSSKRDFNASRASFLRSSTLRVSEADLADDPSFFPLFATFETNRTKFICCASETFSRRRELSKSFPALKARLTSHDLYGKVLIISQPKRGMMAIFALTSKLLHVFVDDFHLSSGKIALGVH